jgi:hypothetical protein
LSASGPTDFCAGDSVVLTATQNPNYTYTWKKYGNVIAGANTNAIVVDKPGKYKVVVEDNNGCLRSSQKITVNIVCREGIYNENSRQINVFPNPTADGILNISFGDQFFGDQTIEILGVDGKLYKKINTADQNLSVITVSVSDMPSGIYLVRLISNGISNSNTFIIQ